MTTMTKDSARVYVGTYAKYNAGSIEGAWLDLSEYSDHDEFLAACRELHKDEQDAELMFQDYEGFPEAFYSEAEIKAELWDWLALDEDDRELLEVFKEHIDQDGDIDRARECFDGKHRSKEEWAEEFMESTGDLNDVPEHIRRYFNFEAFARDCELGGDMTFVEREGMIWAFSNNR